MGDVQSGKTGNYIGVACKAADYGYKFIVLLAGMHNNLRTQTQERVEEGFIGPDPNEGVGFLDPTVETVSLTTRTSDFKREIADAATISFDSVKVPIVLVVKKQKRVLENLIAWVQSKNRTGGGVIRGVPMLLLDDEADNASVNTRADGSPTQINALIRQLLAQFEQNCYLGYTATPFANIFIDPDTNDQMLQDDLFPRDFIVALDAPTNYVGAVKIFGEDGEHRGMLREVEDHLPFFPEAHKKEHRVEELPGTLYEAIRSFVLSRAIRMLRGQVKAHNSMLVNVSRFNNVQNDVSALIRNYVGQLLDAVQAHAALPAEEALRDSTIASIHATWEGEFKDAGHSWDEIQGTLNDAVGPIAVKTIHMKSKEVLDYRKHKETGLNVIAVGGLSLSRGFTLEGLTVSYFLRNSIMYDTLLQMGRWFGYRDGYADLCRIYMTPDAISWYSHIAAATLELREEIKEMERQQRTPKEFGLKVRAHPDALIVTARNKMRTGRSIPISVSLREELVETVYLKTDSILSNRRAMVELVTELDTHFQGRYTRAAEGEFWRAVAPESVKDFIRKFKNHALSTTTEAGPLVRFIEAHEKSQLAEWDVCIYDPANSLPMEDVAGHKVHPADRNAPNRGDHFRVSGKSSRVAGRGAEKAGLTPEQIDRAKARFKALNPDKKNISDRFYRAERDRPLLMLHILKIEGVEGWVPAWGISFPGTLPEGDTVEYVVNTTWYREHFEDTVDEESEELEENGNGEN
jgi:hypothetical protein